MFLLLVFVVSDLITVAQCCCCHLFSDIHIDICNLMCIDNLQQLLMFCG